MAGAGRTGRFRRRGNGLERRRTLGRAGACRVGAFSGCVSPGVQGVLYCCVRVYWRPRRFSFRAFVRARSRRRQRHPRNSLNRRTNPPPQLPREPNQDRGVACRRRGKLRRRLRFPLGRVVLSFRPSPCQANGNRRRGLAAPLRKAERLAQLPPRRRPT
jgi:hypothetical protein